VRIPRWTGILTRRELHVFADASENAYAAAIYLRGIGQSGEWQSSFLVVKTKVAPLKLKSIPRRELCGALLAARLLQKVADGLHIKKEVLYAWSDAKVALAWIKAHPSRWVTFVANRVAAIQEIMPENCWRYVTTQRNPADLATRDISVEDYKEKSLWWHGPSWLRSSSETWPNDEEVKTDIVEELQVYVTSIIPVMNNARCCLDLLSRFSSFTRLTRLTAYCLRWLHGTKLARGSLLSKTKLDNSSRCWLNIVQKCDFSEELCSQQRRSDVAAIPALGTFLLADGLIRVGGRLVLSFMDYAEKHPVVLARDSHLSLLLVREAHALALHGGP